MLKMLIHFGVSSKQHDSFKLQFIFHTVIQCFQVHALALGPSFCGLFYFPYHWIKNEGDWLKPFSASYVLR